MKKDLLSKNFIIGLIATLCCLLWGSAFPMIKLGYQFLSIQSNDTGSIILFAGFRFFIAGVLTIIIFSIATKKPLIPTKSALPRITVLSLFQTVLQYIFFYLGLAFTTGEKASIINGSSCVFALLVSVYLFKSEKMTPRKIVASLLCFAGVVLSSINFGSVCAFSFSIGDVFILLSAVSYALSSAFLRKYSQYHSPYMLSGYQFMLGGAVMTVVGLLMHGTFDFTNIKGILVSLYLALVSAVAYSLWGLLLKYNPVSRIAVCGAMTPIFGYLLSLILLHNDTNNMVYNIIALLLVVIGIITINKSKS